MILVIDNYDSFTYNLVQYLGQLGADIVVRRNDAITTEEASGMNPTHLLISPGPGGPEDGGISGDLLDLFRGKVPVLGVCLGHQILAHRLGSQIVRATIPMHGKITSVHHDGSGVLAGLSDPFPATRYHSLVIEPSSLPDELRITAQTEDGIIMGITHVEQPLFGVQFHPESIATDGGMRILENFLERS